MFAHNSRVIVEAFSNWSEYKATKWTMLSYGNRLTKLVIQTNVNVTYVVVLCGQLLHTCVSMYVDEIDLGDPPREEILSKYGDKLQENNNLDNQISEFRTQWPDKFRALCFLQLSLMLDVPLDLYHESGEFEKKDVKFSALRRILSLSRIPPDSSTSCAVTSERLAHLQSLIDSLNTDETLKTEGLFRKTGNLTRKRLICNALWTMQPDGTPHELAGALKTCISQLPSPLLTHRLLPLFISATHLWRPCVEKETSNTAYPNPLSREKQLKALRLLVQLLPESNRCLLHSLLGLLRRVVDNTSHSRMSALALGTIFGPVLVPSISDFSHNTPNKMSSMQRSRCRELCDEAIDLATCLIQLNDNLFLIPASLAEDVLHNLHECEEAAVANTTPATSPQHRGQQNSYEEPWKFRSPCRPPFSSLSCTPAKKKLPSPIRTKIRFASKQAVIDSPISGENANVLVEVSNTSCKSIIRCARMDKLFHPYASAAESASRCYSPQGRHFKGDQNISSLNHNTGK